MKYIVDSSAWIEYLEGSKLGEKIREIIISENEIYVLNLIIAEVVSKVKRKNSDAELAYKTIITNSKIIELTPKIAKEAGLFHSEERKKIRNFGLVDSLILVAAKLINAKIVTKDEHLLKFKEAFVI
ncbi:MAG: PIN domain-containing protein [Nanoarchaeota archaeon]